MRAEGVSDDGVLCSVKGLGYKALGCEVEDVLGVKLLNGGKD